MSSLLLVRHGQASFLSEDYDRLSALGVLQSQLLGAYWHRLGLRPSRVISGPRKRQRATADSAGQALTAAGGSWPEREEFAELDEHRIDQQLLQQLTSSGAAHPEIARDLTKLTAAGTPLERARAIELLLQTVMRLWADEALGVSGIETYAEFVARVTSGLQRAVSQAERGSTTILFTSGGTIGAIIAQVLRAPGHGTLELGWSVRNASVSELRCSGSRVTLHAFNGVAHLDDPKLWTYR